MEKKESRRVKMTKQLLKNSLIELLHTKNIRNITVTELCEIADVNRSTFYAYYDSPYDLMIATEKDIVDDSFKMLEGCPDFPHQKKMLYLLETHLVYVKTHIEEFRAFSSDIGEDFNLPIKTMEIIVLPYLTELSRKASLSEEDEAHKCTFCIYGIIGIVKRWIREGTVTDEKVLAEKICALIETVFE